MIRSSRGPRHQNPARERGLKRFIFDKIKKKKKVSVLRQEKKKKKLYKYFLSVIGCRIWGEKIYDDGG